MATPTIIHLSLVSHTNIGKTTLARTLLKRDIGQVDDRAHVTEYAQSYPLAEDALGNQIVLWDTPGFGDSNALWARLSQRSNPLGWFLGQYWDRLSNRTLWLDQQAVEHIREQSDVVLYLINATESPDTCAYLHAEMNILLWVQKPVIVLLNQLGQPKGPQSDQKECELWAKALAPYPFVLKVLPFDAFARCWVQENVLFQTIAQALTGSQQQRFIALSQTLERARQATFDQSLQAITHFLTTLNRQSVAFEALQSVDYFKRLKAKLTPTSALNNAQQAAQQTLLVGLQNAWTELLQSLIALHQLSADGPVDQIIEARLIQSLSVANYSTASQTKRVLSSGLGAVAGATTVGVMADLMTGGLTLGMGTLVGGLLGALGGLGASAVWQRTDQKDCSTLAWSHAALNQFTQDAMLLYLAIAHYGRGRGHWAKSETPDIWKHVVPRSAQRYPIHWHTHLTASALQALLAHRFEMIFNELYPECAH